MDSGQFSDPGAHYMHQRSHLYPGMELKLGVFWFFLVIKITVVRLVRMSLHPLQSECEDKSRTKCCMVHEDHGRIGFVFVFACVVGRNAKTPKLSCMANDAITQGCMGSLGSLVYVTLIITSFKKLVCATLHKYYHHEESTIVVNPEGLNLWRNSVYTKN